MRFAIYRLCQVRLYDSMLYLYRMNVRARVAFIKYSYTKIMDRVGAGVAVSGAFRHALESPSLPCCITHRFLYD